MNEENMENKLNDVSEPTTEPVTETTTTEPQPEKKPDYPIFRLKLKAKMLEAIFTAIATIIDEATFQISAVGVNLKAMDPSRVVMVVFNYPKEAFEEFSVEREGKIAFSLTEALKVLKRAGKDETIELVLGKREILTPLEMWIRGKYERVFNLPILEPMEEELPTPKLNHEATIKLTVQALNNAIEDSALVSDHVRVITASEVLEFEVAGDTTTGNIKFVKGVSPDLLDLEKQDMVNSTKATFSLQYFKEIAKGMRGLADVAVIRYSSDMPIQIDVQNTKGSMTFYQAPRIEVKD